MSRSLSAAVRTAIFSQETDKVFLPLIEITHPTLATPFRFVRDGVSIVSGGYTYYPVPFNITLPNDLDDGAGVKTIQLTIDNVDRVIMVAVRSITDAPQIRLMIVLADNPSVVEVGPLDLTLTAVTYNADTISGTLVFEDRMQINVPALAWNPSDFPGVFA